MLTVLNVSLYSSLLCRLTYALSLNFLAMIHLDGHVTGAMESVETSFTTVSISNKNYNIRYIGTMLLSIKQRNREFPLGLFCTINFLHKLFHKRRKESYFEREKKFTHKNIVVSSSYINLITVKTP